MRIAILGGGGLAREVADVVDAVADAGGKVQLVGFLDDDPETHGVDLNGFPVLGGVEWLAAHAPKDLALVCAIGSPAVKRRVVQRAQGYGVPFATLVHPSARITRHVKLGVGVVVTAGCTLTNRIQIGDHVFLNLHTTVGHDSRIASFCNAAPGVHVSGNVTLGEGCDLGTGSVVIQGRTVGDWTIVGAGAVVSKDLPPNATAVGVPAAVIKTREPGWHE